MRYVKNFNEDWRTFELGGKMMNMTLAKTQVLTLHILQLGCMGL